MADVRHSTLSGADLHNPKQHALESDTLHSNAGDAGDVLVSNGDETATWTPAIDTIIPLASLKWNDLQIPISLLTVPGAASDPGVDTTDGCLIFDAASTEVIPISVQMPHDWAEGTAVRPHIHWNKTTAAAGDVAWELLYNKATPGGDFAGTFTSLGIVSDPVSGTTDNNTTTRHLITDLGEIDMTGNTISTIIKFQLQRVGGNAADTYAADAKAVSFDVHYQIDDFGSAEEYTK